MRGAAIRAPVRRASPTRPTATLAAVFIIVGWFTSIMDPHPFLANEERVEFADLKVVGVGYARRQNYRNDFYAGTMRGLNLGARF